MTTWAPISNPSTTWTEDTPPLRTFSQFVFSREFFGGKRVFSMGVGVWNSTDNPSTTWTPK